MKRPIAIALLTVGLGLTTLYQYKYPVVPPTSEVLHNQDAEKSTVIKVPEMTELGIPTANSFTSQFANSRNPWDIAFFDGKLYVGCGDYGQNSGPCSVWQYDPETKLWTDTGKVNDEAIANFEIIDNTLIITGTDPKSSWEYGSFYTYTAEGWQTDRTVPCGVHMFDIARYQGKTFYGIGTSNNKQSPVQMTEDGINYTNIPICYEDTAILNNPDYGYSRCYNLFESDDRLYAFCWLTDGNGKSKTFSVFKYDGEAFRYLTQIGALGVESNGANRQTPLNKALFFDGRFYFSAGILYSSKDFTEATRHNIPDNSYVQDLLVRDNRLYVLTSQKHTTETVDENGQPKSIITYTNKIFEYTEETDLTEIYSFDYGVSAMSLEKNGDTYYIGMGLMTDGVTPSTVTESPVLLNGTILQVEFVEKVITE